jgi:hypothetical protein
MMTAVEKGVMAVINAMIAETNEQQADLDAKLGPMGPCSRHDCERNDLLEGRLDALVELRERLRRPVGG